MSEDKTLTKIPHYDDHCDHLSELMENLLRAKSLWSVVKIGFLESKEGTMLTEAQKIGFLEPKEGTMLTEAQKGHLDDARHHQVKHHI